MALSKLFTEEMESESRCFGSTWCDGWVSLITSHLHNQLVHWANTVFQENARWINRTGSALPKQSWWKVHGLTKALSLSCHPIMLYRKGYGLVMLLPGPTFWRVKIWEGGGSVAFWGSACCMTFPR